MGKTPEFNFNKAQEESFCWSSAILDVKLIVAMQSNFRGFNYLNILLCQKYCNRKIDGIFLIFSRGTSIHFYVMELILAVELILASTG